MIKRPNREENEEDLLRFQEQFGLRNSSPAAKVVRVASDSRKRDVVSLDKNEDDLVESEKQHKEHAPLKKSRFKARLDRVNQSKDSTAKDRVEENVDVSHLLDSHDRHITAVLTKIQERETKAPIFTHQNRFIGGFPVAPHIGKDDTGQNKVKEGKKQSLFARQFGAKNPSLFGLIQPVPQTTPSCLPEEKSAIEKPERLKESYSPEFSTMVTGEGLGGESSSYQKSQIHEENANRLSDMSTEEILEEQAKLKSSLDPKILAFIASKRANNQSATAPNQDAATLASKSDRMEVEESSVQQQPHQGAKGRESVKGESNFDPHEEFQIKKDLPGMKIIEDEKLQWMKEPPKPLFKNEEQQTGIAARFDLDGNLAARTSETNFDRALHHHGEDPNAPGYTLEELFHLARCNFKQQRVFALQLIARIIEQFHKGNFRDHLQSCLLKQLLDAGLPFLLRWSLDENTEAIFSAAVYAFSALLTIPCDNDAVDEMLYTDRGIEIPCLKPEDIDTRHMDEDEKRDLTDPEMMDTDVIRGLIQMQILPRLRYILEVCEPSKTSVNNIMAILTRVTLHSTAAAYEVMRCPRLVETICSKYLPLTWKDEDIDDERDDNVPYSSAIRLIRCLCVSGRNIASKLWVDFEICSKVLRYASILNEEDNIHGSFIVESLHVWRVCLSYGFASSTTRDVYALLISLLQKFAMTAPEESPDILPALILLAEAITQATTVKSQDTHEGSAEKDGGKSVRFSGLADEDVDQLDWNLVAGIHPITSQLIKECTKRFTAGRESSENHRVLSCLLLYLSAYFKNAKLQKSLNKVDVLSEIESWKDVSISRLVNSEQIHKILAETRQGSELTKTYEELDIDEPIKSLPSYGMKIFKNGSNCVQKKSTFVLLSAFAKLLSSLTDFHKGCHALAFDFVTSQDILEYLNLFCKSATSTKISCTSVSSSMERSFLFHLIKLFKSSVLFVGLEKANNTVVKTYHLACLKLFSILQDGEEFLAKELLSDVIFQKAFFPEICDVFALTARLGDLNLSSSVDKDNTNSQSINRLLSSALENLPFLGDTYATICFRKLKKKIAISKNKYHQDGSKINSFFLPRKSGTLLPIDWVFQPIVELYHMATNVELSGQVISQLSADSVKTLEKTLLFSLLLEIWRPEYFVSIPSTIRFVRLLCVFLIGNDAFLESPIYQLLEAFLKLFTSVEMQERLNFEMNFPGISSFYDLYNSLLVQFSASSFGDPVFSNFLLIPLQQQYNSQYRKALWTEGANILRVFPLPIQSVAIDLGKFFEPQEEDEEVLRLYLTSLSDGSARPAWCPFFYLVAVGQLSNFIFNMADTQDFFEIRVGKARLDMLQRVINLKNKDVKMDIIMFDKMDLKVRKGFRTLESLPTLRQILIEKVNAMES